MKHRFMAANCISSERSVTDSNPLVWRLWSMGVTDCAMVGLTGLRSAIALAAGALLLGLSASVADAQPAPFFSPLESWSGTGGFSSAGRVSPSGDWVFGSQDGDMGTFWLNDVLP